jgi:hypothetical protein
MISLSDGRITMDEIFEHQWMKGPVPSEDELISAFEKRLMKAKAS